MENKFSQMSMLEVAYTLMTQKRTPQQINKLITEVLEIKDITDEDGSLTTQLYIDITTSSKFVYMGNNEWDLKERQSLDEWDKDGSAFNTKEDAAAAAAFDDDEDDELDLDDEAIEDEEDDSLDDEDDEDDFDGDDEDDDELKDDDDEDDDDTDDFERDPDGEPLEKYTEDDDFDEDKYNDLMDDFEDMYEN